MWMIMVDIVLVNLGDPKSSPYSFSYVQGMNCLLAPLLYVMPEADAFYTFDILLRTCLPTYVQPSLDGVHEGVKVSLDLFFFISASETISAPNFPAHGRDSEAG